MIGTLGYTPFVDPLQIHSLWWWTLVPMALFVSMAYKAVRLGELKGYWKNVGVMWAQIVLGLIALAVGLHVLIEWVVPVFA